MDTILEVNNLSKQFYKNKKLFTAVNGISFTLQRGECLGIVGESRWQEKHYCKNAHPFVKTGWGGYFPKRNRHSETERKTIKEFYTEIQMVFQVPQDSFDPRKK